MLLLRWLLSALSLLIVARLVPGFEITSLWAALIVALVLGLLNALVRPVLLLLTLPVTVLTLGIFIFVINALLLIFTANIIEGFSIASFSAAFWGAVVLWLVGMAINSFLGGTKAAKA